MYPKKALSETVLKACIMRTLNNSSKSKAKGKSVTKSITFPGYWTFKSTYGIYAIHINSCNTQKALRKQRSIFCNILPFCKSLSVSRNVQWGRELNRNINAIYLKTQVEVKIKWSSRLAGIPHTPQKSNALPLFMFCFQSCKRTKWAVKKAVGKRQY